MFDNPDLLLRVLIGLVCGTLIGMERQWRARSAGLRTNALVALGATLFVVMGGFGFGSASSDPTRVAAQVVSGIGFLGAGVIMQQGTTISGMNTAATLWASAAVGCLAGAGMYLIAAAGTVAVVLTNMLMRPFARVLDRLRGGHGEHTALEYDLAIDCTADHEPVVRALLSRSLAGSALSVQAISTRPRKHGGVRVRATVTASEHADAEVEALLHHLVPEPAITGVSWSARELGGDD